MSDFWKFFTGIAVAVAVYGLSYLGMVIAGSNVYLAGILAGGFAAIAFYGVGSVLGYSVDPDDEI